jgi:hemoglobin-like flavoprotein
MHISGEALLELSAIVSGIGILEGMISNAIYDLLKSRLKKEPLTKNDIASIVCDALHEMQDVYLKKYSEMLYQVLGTQNEALVKAIIQQIRKLFEQYKIPPIERDIGQTEEARQVANEIAQDIGSHLIEHSQLFLLISKEVLRSEDFKRSPFIFAQTERFLGKSQKTFQQMLREYLDTVEEEAMRRSLNGDLKSAIFLYKILVPPYRLILHDREKAAKALNRLADHFLAKKNLEKAARYYKLLDRKKSIELYEKMGRYREVAACYELEGQLGEVTNSFKKWQDKRKEWEATRKNIKKRIRELERSSKERKRELGELRKSGKISERELMIQELDWPNEQTDLELEELELWDMQVKSSNVDYLSLDAILESWNEALFGSPHLHGFPKSEKEYMNEGSYHLVAILNLRSGRNDLAREFFEKAIERFDKKGHQKALEGDFASFRIYLEMFCCQMLAAATEFGPKIKAFRQGSFGWKKLIEASRTLQIIFEINHQKKTGPRSKELSASIASIYHKLRIGLIDPS